MEQYSLLQLIIASTPTLTRTPYVGGFMQQGLEKPQSKGHKFRKKTLLVLSKKNKSI